MQAFKCDRCGIFYGKYKLTNEYSFRGAPIKVSSGDVGLDLCSDCRKKLIEFMKSGKENDIPKSTCCDPGFYQEVPEIDPLPYRIENATECLKDNKYPCCRCQHIENDGKTCYINAELDCSINPEKYWVEREDCKGKSCHTCRHEDGLFCKVNMQAKNWSDRCYNFAKWEPKEE